MKRPYLFAHRLLFANPLLANPLLANPLLANRLFEYKAVALRALTILLTTLLISNCGWHLRGYGNAPQAINSIYISSKSGNNALVRDLERALRAQDVAVKDNANEAEYGLIILDQRSKRRTATVSGSARISEQELSESVDFTVVASDGSTALPLSTATVDRIFEYNEDNILATDDEARLLRSEMQRDLVRQILNRLQAVGRSTAPTSSDATAP